MFGSMSTTQLAAQASHTAHGYLANAINSVNELLGDGAAARHPELVVALVNAAAKDYAAGVVSHHVVPALDGLASAIRDAGSEIRAGLE